MLQKTTIVLLLIIFGKVSFAGKPIKIKMLQGINIGTVVVNNPLTQAVVLVKADGTVIGRRNITVVNSDAATAASFQISSEIGKEIIFSIQNSSLSNNANEGNIKINFPESNNSIRPIYDDIPILYNIPVTVSNKKAILKCGAKIVIPANTPSGLHSTLNTSSLTLMVDYQ
jgi:hypothetical protein